MARSSSDDVAIRTSGFVDDVIFSRRACLFARLSFNSHISETTCLNFVKFLCGRASSFSSGVVIRYALLVFSARCNIYISRLCYDVSVRLFLCDGSALAHYS